MKVNEYLLEQLSNPEIAREVAAAVQVLSRHEVLKLLFEQIADNPVVATGFDFAQVQTYNAGKINGALSFLLKLEDLSIAPDPGNTPSIKRTPLRSNFQTPHKPIK